MKEGRFLQESTARETTQQENATSIAAPTCSCGWTVHKDLDLILKQMLGFCSPYLSVVPFAGLQMGPWKDRVNKTPNHGNTTGFPAAMFQPLVKAKKSVSGKCKGRQFYRGQDNVALKAPLVYVKTTS